MICNHEVIDKIKKLPESGFLEPGLDNIRKIGNIGSHANITIITDEEIEKMIDSLFKMMAYFFIIFFKKNKFGSDSGIVSHFSLLPAIVRYNVLSYLFKEEKNDELIIEKLAVVTLKAFGKEKAIKWLQKNEKKFREIKIRNEEDEENLRKKGDSVSKAILQLSESRPHNLYDYCMGKVIRLSEYKISPFKSMEDSYEKFEIFKKSIDKNDSKRKEFMDIMEFLYLGREKYNGNITKCEKCDKLTIGVASTF